MIQGFRVEAPSARVYLYTHWGGSTIGEVSQSALAKRWRWGDPSYLARIVFDELNVEPGEEAGFGISPFLTDNQHAIVVLDCAAQRVIVETEEGVELGSATFEEWAQDGAQRFEQLDS